MPAPELLVLVDTETTGLLDDARPMGIMEFAWTIIDPDGTQLAPLQQVFTALPSDPAVTVDPGDVSTWPFPHSRVLQPHKDEPADAKPSVVTSWDSGAAYPLPVVREMHDKSGLTDEWGQAYALRPDTVIDRWAEIERLLLDDLIALGWHDRPKASIQLAGDGVAHFEQRFLPHVMPRVFGSPRFHYRTHDVSQILNGLATATDGKTPGNVGGLIEAHLDELTTTTAAWPIINIGSRYSAADRGESGDEQVHGLRYRWARATDVPHRAAADVARILMGHRLLPRLVA